MFRFLLKLLVFGVIATPLIAVALVVLALQDAPLVSTQAQLSAADVERAKVLLRTNDPRKLPAGSVRTVRLQQRDIQLAANYLASHLGRGGAEVTVTPGRFTLRASSEIPQGGGGGQSAGSGHFINIHFEAIERPQGPPAIDLLKIGSLQIPSVLANAGVDLIMRTLPGAGNEGSLASLVRETDLTARRVAITYEWRPDLLDSLRRTVVTADDEARLAVYQAALAETTGKLARGQPLPALLQPLFTLAAERSDATGDPIAENRALLLVLSSYGGGKSLSGLVPTAREWPMAANVRVTLRGRQDFAQHFLTSAGLVVLGGQRFSDLIGVAKEVADSRGGSGFSFTDIAADRAGTVFGETALYSRESARKLQQVLRRGAPESALAPRMSDLPEFLSGEEFAQRYGSVGSEAYRRELDRIEKRIAALKLYRP